MPHIKLYDRGDPIRLRATFTDEFEQLGDPDVVICKVKDPTGTVSSYTYGVDSEVVRNSVGEYQLILTAALEGIYHYRWESSGAGAAAGKHEFRVSDSPFN